MDSPTNSSNATPTILTVSIMYFFTASSLLSLNWHSIQGEEYEAVRRERIERNRALMTQLGLVGADSLFLGISPGSKLTIPTNKPRQIRETSGRNGNKTDMSLRSRLRSSGKVRNHSEDGFYTWHSMLIILISYLATYSNDD